MAVIGTFGSFTAARLGIYASQASLNVTGNNIANTNTKGYTRQRADLVSLYSGGNIRYANKYNTNIGYGVLVDSVSQLRDPFLDILYRDEQSSLGAYEARLEGLDQLSNILDEVGDGEDDFGVIEAQFSDLLQQLHILSRNAKDDTSDTNVRTSAESLVQLFRDYSDALVTTKDNLTKKLEDKVDKVNTILTQIRDLNVDIRDAGIFGDQALELRDERNRLIDELSTYMKIDVRYDMEKIDEFSSVERINISIAGTGNPPIKLIQGIYGTQLTMPETSPMRNPDFDPQDPKCNRYISKASDLAAGKLVYTNMEENALQIGGQMVTNDAAGENLLRGEGYTASVTQPFDGKYAQYVKLDNDGNIVDYTFDPKDATQVNNAVKEADNNRLWMGLEALTDRNGKIMKENGGAVSEPVDLSDTVLYGGLQSLRELITEEGEFASDMDIAFDSKATIKRGVPYYQHALDALARKFADTMNEANKKMADDKGVEHGGLLFSISGDSDDDGRGDPPDFTKKSQITAGNISIAKSWSTGEVRIRCFGESDDGLSHTTDNANVDHMITLMGEKLKYCPKDVVDDAANNDKYFEGTFQEMLNNTNHVLASDKQISTTQYNIYTTETLSWDNKRQSVSGVDLNEEATNMMMFQKSYSAACQLMTTLDSMLDKLINGTIR